MTSTPPQSGSEAPEQLGDDGSSQIINTEEFQKELEQLEKENQAIMKLMAEAYQKFDHISSPESLLVTDNEEEEESIDFSSLSGVSSLITDIPKDSVPKTPITKSKLSTKSPFPGIKSVAASPFISRSFLKENGMKLSPTGTPPSDSGVKLTLNDLKSPAKSSYSNDEVSPTDSSFMSPISEPETSSSSVPRTPISKSSRSSYIETPMKDVVRDLKDSPTPSRARPTPLSQDKKHFVSVSQIDNSFHQSEYIRKLEQRNAALIREIGEKKSQIFRLSTNLHRTLQQTQEQQQKMISQQCSRISALSQKLNSLKLGEEVVRDCFSDFVGSVMDTLGIQAPDLPTSLDDLPQYTNNLKDMVRSGIQSNKPRQISISDDTKQFLSTILSRIDSVEDRMRQVHESFANTGKIGQNTV